MCVVGLADRETGLSASLLSAEVSFGVMGLSDLVQQQVVSVATAAQTH